MGSSVPKTSIPYFRPTSYVPTTRHLSAHDDVVRAEHVAGVASLLDRGDVMVLTGAGVSTASGIPDYRGPQGVHTKTVPMTYQQFRDEPAARHRYWARSFWGWPHVSAAVPNVVHDQVAEWEREGLTTAVVTQNVDGLHRDAGCENVVELHGSLGRVVCLECGQRESRNQLHDRLVDANPQLDPNQPTSEVGPDGDSGASDEAVAAFTMVGCLVCGSVALKPDVVYFGENVPRERVRAAYAALEAASSILVLGSSLTVMSGYRFVRDAAKASKCVGIVNHGATRGDRHATWQVDGVLEEILPAVATCRR